MRSELSILQINAIRQNDIESDMIAAARILESPGALRNRKFTGIVQGAISAPHGIEAKEPRLEAAYSCGLVNAWVGSSLAAIDTILSISTFSQRSVGDSIAAFAEAASRWGASNYLARKISFFKQCFEITEEQQSVLDDIDKVLGHDVSPYLQYSALETLKESISIFSAARRHTNAFKSQDGKDFRSHHNLNNLISTPYSSDDCAGFLLRASESSLVDVIYSFLIILNMEGRYQEVAKIIRKYLDPAVLESMLRVREKLEGVLPPDLYASKADASLLKDLVSVEREDESLALYRRSTFFLEFPRLCGFRNDIDRVIGHRLVAPILPDIKVWNAEAFHDKDVMKREDDRFDLALHGTQYVKVDTFYRTYLFLRFIQNTSNLASLDGAEIRYIFDKTADLESLLLEKELATMHLNASHSARAIISVLALALHRTKSSDPDIDFDFRTQLENYILREYGGDIPRFIESIAPENPQVAHYLATTLDDVTLQKMYCIVNSRAKAETVRRDILMTIGVHLNQIEYIIEAESIETRSKVAKLKEYFDGSRMFVDSMAMKKWLETNPSLDVEQFKELLPKIASRMARPVPANPSDGADAAKDLLGLSQTYDRLIERIAGDAFSVFCLNNEFGIESYLARRIRHNTLHGIMTSGVDAVMRRPEYMPIISGTPFGKALANWQTGYRMAVERMRRDLLQFKSDSRPGALFNSQMDMSDTSTRSNVQRLVSSVWAAGPELLYDLVISFCWLQIAPQLEVAARYIRVAMFREIKHGLDQALSRFNGPEEQKMKLELTDGLSSVLAKVASWFQVPQTGFVPASIREICNIVDIEHDRSASPTVVRGETQGLKYYGISVHRIYDCLAVLLHNAFKHGRRGREVTVDVESSPIDGTSLHSLSLSVTSALPETGGALCIERVSAAITSTETSADLVTEGYSGIKKVKVITRLNEGASTVSFDVTGEYIRVIFSLKAEVAIGEHPDDENITR